MRYITLLLGVVCGALVLACGSVPRLAGGGETPALFAELAETLGRFPDTRAESLGRHYRETITAVDYERYAVVKRVVDYYRGGAHGMAETFYAVFDRGAGRFVTLADVADEARRAALRGAVADALRERFGLRADEPLTAAGLFEDEVALTGNFFLSAGGIGFHWNPYELAPYSFGAIEVVVALE